MARVTHQQILDGARNQSTRFEVRSTNESDNNGWKPPTIVVTFAWMKADDLSSAADSDPSPAASKGSRRARGGGHRYDKAALAIKAKALAVYVPWRVWIDLCRSWVLIGAAIAACALMPTISVVAVCFVVIATQQYALLILMHDGQHSLLHPSRAINNFISKWLIGAPCGTPFVRSQALHLAHHQTVGSTDDPAFQFYCFGEPSPKGSLVSLVVHFLRIMVFGRVAGHTRKGSTKKSEGALASYGPVCLAQAAMVVVFVAAGVWWAYFVLWALPLATLVSFFDAFRQFGEHAEPTPDRSAGLRLISTLSNPVERTFIAPLGMNYHAEHHMFPFVPYYRLRQLSAMISESEAGSAILWRRSYLSSLAIYLRGL